MTALPANLAAVGEDLARATLKDAQNGAKRRRLATCAIAFALLAMTASAAIATGWITDRSPTAGIVPALTDGAAPDEVRVLLTGLGPQLRELKSMSTASGGVCLLVTGFETQCVPEMLARQEISWFTRSPAEGTTIIFGIARPNVTAIETVTRDGSSTIAQLSSGAFYAESSGDPPTHLRLALSDGTSELVAVSPCPPATPDCAH